MTAKAGKGRAVMPQVMVTRFRESFIEDERNVYLRFGSPYRVETERGVKTHVFTPGARFGVVYWWRNKYGTQNWITVIARACALGDPLDALPNVTPGASILLRAQSRGTGSIGPAQRGLAAIDAIERAGFAPERVSDDYWQGAHYRILHRGEPQMLNPSAHVEAA